MCSAFIQIHFRKVKSLQNEGFNCGYKVTDLELFTIYFEDIQMLI